MNRVALERLKRWVAEEGGRPIEQVVARVGRDAFDGLVDASHLTYYRTHADPPELIVVALWVPENTGPRVVEETGLTDADRDRMADDLAGRLGYPRDLLDGDALARPPRQPAEHAAAPARPATKRGKAGKRPKRNGQRPRPASPQPTDDQPTRHEPVAALTEQEIAERIEQGTIPSVAQLIRETRLGATQDPGPAYGHMIEEAGQLAQAASVERQFGTPAEADRLNRRAASLHRMAANAHQREQPAGAGR